MNKPSLVVEPTERASDLLDREVSTASGSSGPSPARKPNGDVDLRRFKARDADAAMVIIESGAAFDLLFTDVVMPGELGARDLARQAQKRLPGLPVLFTSGYTDNAIVHGGRLDDGVDLLSKPYTRDELARKLRKALAPRPAPIPSPEQVISG